MESMDSGSFWTIHGCHFFLSSFEVENLSLKTDIFLSQTYPGRQPAACSKSPNFRTTSPMDAPRRSCFKDWLTVIGTIARRDITPRKTNIVNPKMEVDGRCFSFSNGVILQVKQPSVFRGYIGYMYFLPLLEFEENGFEQNSSSSHLNTPPKHTEPWNPVNHGISTISTGERRSSSIKKSTLLLKGILQLSLPNLVH